MSDPEASTNGTCLIGFGSFPREIRDAIYRKCVVVEEPIDIMDDLGDYFDMTPLMYHYRQIHETFGVLDGKDWPTTYTNEAREVFVAENTFIVPCSELADFLAFQYTDNYGTSFDPKLFVRSLVVEIHYDVCDDASWLFEYQVPGLRRLLDCPCLQEMELSIRGPGGRAAKSETTQMIMNIMNVCVELWKKLGRGMKTFRYDYDPYDEDEDTSVIGSPIQSLYQESNQEDESSSETNSNGQLSDADGEHSVGRSEDDNYRYYGPGEYTLKAGIIYRFKRVDVSEIWQRWLGRLKEKSEE